jgi:hypothetical protein
MEAKLTIETLKDQMGAHEIHISTNEAGKVTTLETKGSKITCADYAKLVQICQEQGFLAEDFVGTPPPQDHDDPREVAKKLAAEAQPTEG